MAALADELGFRSTCETDGIKKCQRAKEALVEKQRWRSDPARRSSGIKWRKEEHGKSNVEEYVSIARVLDSPDDEYAACFVPGPTTHGGITRKIGRGAGATGAEAAGPEMVAPSVGREGTRLDCRHFGNGGWTVGAGSVRQGAQTAWPREKEESNETGARRKEGRLQARKQWSLTAATKALGKKMNPR